MWIVAGRLKRFTRACSSRAGPPTVPGWSIRRAAVRARGVGRSSRRSSTSRSPRL